MVTKSQKRRIAEPRAAWEECWESILRLPLEPLLASHLRAEAKQLVQICRSRTRDKAIAWLWEEVEDAVQYVAAQVANDPGDPEWRRIEAVLTGAQAGLAADTQVDQLDHKSRAGDCMSL